MDFSRAERTFSAKQAGEACDFNLRADVPELLLLRVVLDEPADLAFYANLPAVTAATRIDWRVYAGAPSCRPSNEPVAVGSSYLAAAEERCGCIFTLRGLVASTFLLSVQIVDGDNLHGTVSFLARAASSSAGAEAGPVIG